MTISVRKYFFDEVMVNGNTELDFIKGSIPDMDLRTVDFFTVTASTEDRLDLISFKYYGSYDFGWLIAEHNDLLDPVSEVKIGLVLKIPSMTDYYQYYNRNTRVP